MSLLSAAQKGFQAQKGLKSVSRGYGGTLGGIWGFGQAPSGRNWAVEAGLKYDKSVVFAAIMFACGALGEVDIYVRRKNSAGDWAEVPDHPITKLLNHPNDWYGLSTLMSGWIISELTSQFGSSYTYKHRSPAGRLIGLEYIPHFAIRPFTSPDTSNFIDKYLMGVRGGITDVDPSRILQQRYGPIDPLYPQVSYGPLNACLREVCTDSEALNYTASLLYNMGVTPHLISPATRGDEQVVYDDTDQKVLRQRFREITGRDRGVPLFSPIPIKVDDLSFNPSDMNLDGIHELSEERVCGVLRIPPLCLNFGTGLSSSNNRAGADAAAKAGARNFTKPYMMRKAEDLTNDLVEELGEPGDQVCFRWEAIEALQEDKTETAKRDQIQVSTYLTVNEKRHEKGLPPIEGGDVCLWQNVTVQADKEEPNDSPDADPDDENGTGKPAPKPKKRK